MKTILIPQTAAGLLFIAVVQAQDVPEVQVMDLIESLRSDKVEEREDAVRGLRRLGRDAISQLERASFDNDSEVALRSRQVLEGIRATLGEAMFRRIEKRIEEEDSLEITFRWEVASKDNFQDARGGKGTITISNGELTVLTVSNLKPGTDLSLGSSSGSSVPAQRVLGRFASSVSTLKCSFARAGIFYSLISIFEPRARLNRGGDRTDPKKMLLISELTYVGEVREAGILRYQLNDVESDRVFQVTLYCDAKTDRLIKRVLTMEDSRGEWTCTEIYDGYGQPSRGAGDGAP